jgi:hypothetical protein
MFNRVYHNNGLKVEISATLALFLTVTSCPCPAVASFQENVRSDEECFALFDVGNWKTEGCHGNGSIVYLFVCLFVKNKGMRGNVG